MVLDAIVSVAVQKLSVSLIEIVARRLRIREDVEWLRNELLYMQSFLKDAEEKQSKDHRVKQWVSDITNLAYDTVDILDDFNINADRGSGEASNPGFVDRVKKCACFCKKEANLYDVGNEIESLRKRVLDLSRKRETYGITNISDAGEGPSNMRELRRTTSYLEEEKFVGFEDVTKMLLAELLKAEDCRCVISIFGMGGLGKTTLARKLYNSVDIQRSFTRRAWVCVSQEYRVEDLLRTIIKSFKRRCTKEEIEMLEKMNREDLERYLREFLKEDRYLVVVDDVWHKEAWESLKQAFPDRRNGSRVIITMRKKEVAERVNDRSFVHNLRFLTQDESWDLFKKKISRGDGHGQWFSPAMQKMGKEMVENCGGLPLAVVVLGGLLSNKKEVEKWHKVKEQLWQHIKNDTIEVTHLLSLSYNDLSDALKQCFLYVGIYPKDYVIPANNLMWLWMAEGFIPQSNRMEDVAEDYLHELINRSLIQVDRTLWGRIAACRIHDLLRDLVIEKAMEVNLFDIYDPRVYSGLPSRRRQVIYTQIQKFFSCDLSSAKLRSLVLFNPDSERPDVRNLMLIFEKFKYLCVLDLARVRFLDLQMLPDAIENLIHLKFLSLDCTSFKELPPSIGNLKSLQTLLITGSYSAPCRLPLEISKLINLRHLFIHNSIRPLQIDTLINLRTLNYVNYDPWIDIDTVNLVNIQELYLVSIAPLVGKAYSLDSISNLKSLTTLTLHSTETLPPLEPLFSCPSLLRLWLIGNIEKLPPFDEFFQSLTMLILEKSLLREDPMPMLEKLPSLRGLKLRDDAYIGKEITCSSNGFQQLESLSLDGLTNLENWRLAETAMPVIRSLRIVGCPKLETIPQRLKSILKPV